jgi:hypothetical protein
MNAKMFKPFLTLFSLLFVTQIYAQMGIGKIEEIEQVKSRKLIVMIEEPREKMLKKIEKRAKRGSVEDYKADLKSLNENMKAVVEKFWPYNKTGIQYKTFDEIEALKKTKSEEYAVLTCLSAKPSTMGAGFKYAEGIYWVKDIKEDFEDRDDLMVSMLIINTIEDWGKKPVYYVPLFDVFPTKASLVYGVKGIEIYFNMRIQKKKNGVSQREQQELQEVEMKIRAPKVANKTLLLRQEWLDEELTADNLKNYYPYKYQVCDRELMDKIVMEQDGNYAYGVVLPYVVSGGQRNSVIYIQYVMDGADSQPMCFVRPSMGSMMAAGSIGTKAGKRNFTIKIMEKVVEQVKGKSK